jgi:hypothetical protein
MHFVELQQFLWNDLWDSLRERIDLWPYIKQASLSVNMAEIKIVN